jgi:carbon-monoxide dehydrogenase large subunit
MNVHDTSGAFDMNKYGIGQPVRRTEDPILVQGQGRYTDDLTLPGQAYAVFVRSRNGHGIIKAIDTAAAKAMPGVLAIYTGADLASYGTLKCAVPFKNRDGSEMKKPARPSMPSDKVRFVGDPIAVVIAKTVAQAKDAAEAVEVDIETLPSVTQASEAAKPGAPQLYDDVPGNVALDYLYGEPEKVAEAFAKAAHVTKLHLVNSRLVVNAMEPRSAIASFDKASGRYTMNIGCQGAFGMKGQLVDILGTTPDKVHVLTGNVGGSFGMKAAVYPEYVPLLHAAKELGVPVKWTADRFESFVSDHHGRDHEFDGELALDEKGKFLAARFKGFGNTGAYLGPVSPLMSTLNIVKNAVSVYKIPLIEVATKVMFTNTVLVSAYRGAGRPEGNYYMERLIDRAAEEMGIDRFALRKRNQIRKSEIPYKSSSGMQYDSGDFPAIFERAVEIADIKGFKQRKRESKKRGKLRGLGVGSYLEVTAPPNKEMGGIRFEENGDVTIITGTLDYGQGHAAPFAQVLTEKLGVPFERIKLLQGDSDELLAGGGTGGSRSMYASGTAILEGADEVIKKGKQIAGFVLEASAGDIEFGNGTFTIAGTDRAIGIMELADKLRGGLKMPEGVPNSLSVKHVTAEPIPSVFPNGCHVAEVEIDPDTGVIEIVSYNSVNDFGTIINPLLVAGQVHGGVVQGIGQALMEKTAYDADGQLLTGSYMDYAMPRAEDMPEIGFESHPVPAKNNPLGVKGCGEAGCAGALTCVMNAIVDALSEYGVANVEMPATPERVWQTIQDARTRHTM